MRVATLLFCTVLLLLPLACRRTSQESKQPGSGCTPLPTKTLGVTLHPQDVDQWCWAASAQMIMEFLNHNVSECTQANDAFGRADCCNSSVPSDCNNADWPHFDKYNFDYRRTSDSALTWDQLKEQVSCQNSPVAFSWGWSNGIGGHMMVVVGYNVVNGTNYVIINDPWEPKKGKLRQPITYGEYVSGSELTHCDNF